MKKSAQRFLFTMIFAMAAIVFLMPGIGTAEVNWSTFEEGMKLAKKGDKNILVTFFSKKCGYCDMMAEKTFSDQSVMDYLNKNYVPILIMVDDEENLPEEFPFRGVPFMWFAESNGEKIAPMVGYQPPEFFLMALKYIASNSYQSMTFEEYVDKGLPENQ